MASKQPGRFQKAALKMADSGSVISLEGGKFVAPDLHTGFRVVNVAIDPDITKADDIIEKKAYWRARRSQRNQKKTLE